MSRPTGYHISFRDRLAILAALVPLLFWLLPTVRADGPGINRVASWGTCPGEAASYPCDKWTGKALPEDKTTCGVKQFKDVKSNYFSCAPHYPECMCVCWQVYEEGNAVMAECTWLYACQWDLEANKCITGAAAGGVNPTLYATYASDCWACPDPTHPFWGAFWADEN